jgi:hypothetical protein
MESFLCFWVDFQPWLGTSFFFGSTAVFGALLVPRYTDDPECQEEYECANDESAHLLEKYVKILGRRMK